MLITAIDSAVRGHIMNESGGEIFASMVLDTVGAIPVKGMEDGLRGVLDDAWEGVSKSTKQAMASHGSRWSASALSPQSSVRPRS